MKTVQEVTIRDARDEEREAIANLMLEAYQQYAYDLPKARWEEYSHSIRDSVYGDVPFARIVAELEGNIVGSVQLFLSSQEAYSNPEMGISSPIIRLLAVSPAARGRGIATQLIREAAVRSLRLGASTLHLHTSDMMASAVRLYERLGFARAYETDTYNGETLVKGYRLCLSDFSLLPSSTSSI